MTDVWEGKKCSQMTQTEEMQTVSQSEHTDMGFLATLKALRVINKKTFLHPIPYYR